MGPAVGVALRVNAPRCVHSLRVSVCTHVCAAAGTCTLPGVERENAASRGPPRMGERVFGIPTRTCSLHMGPDLHIYVPTPSGPIPELPWSPGSSLRRGDSPCLLGPGEGDRQPMKRALYVPDICKAPRDCLPQVLDQPGDRMVRQDRARPPVA